MGGEAPPMSGYDEIVKYMAVAIAVAVAVAVSGGGGGAVAVAVAVAVAGLTKRFFNL